jgi:hypothetical protein
MLKKIIKKKLPYIKQQPFFTPVSPLLSAPPPPKKYKLHEASVLFWVTINVLST